MPKHCDNSVSEGRISTLYTRLCSSPWIRLSYMELKLSYMRHKLSYMGLRLSHMGLILDYMELKVSYSVVSNKRVPTLIYFEVKIGQKALKSCNFM